MKLTAANRQEAIRIIQEMDLTKPKRLEWKDWRQRRGIDHNALSWVFYKLIGDYVGMTTDEAHADCKIRFGLPILFSSGSDYAYDVSLLLEGVSFYGLTVESQWRAITPIQVTSKFDTKQMSEYIESMQHYYGVQGLILDSNNDK